MHHHAEEIHHLEETIELATQIEPKVWLYTLVAVVTISLISFIGVFTLSMSKRTLSKFLMYMVSFATGALLGDAFLHLLPKAAHEFGFGLDTSICVLAGIVVFFVVEKFIHFRHCHRVPDKSHPHPFAIMNLIGDSIHNFIDGLIIAASFVVSIEVGIATTLAVIFHEIPQEIGDFGVLIHGGFSRGRALLLNFVTAFTAVLGAITALLIGTHTEGIFEFLIPFAAGGFIYIACSDLIPEIHKESRLPNLILQFTTFALGIGVMALLMTSHAH
ncbi:ZIP family metal transporter [Candidatus Peregrinibacteria bacterium]|jgi:zinc and cadmium transporter|nr:ZIP family metal transporter [Candidatus Peregrinibacteria bacterium]